ncbi:MAG: hypothetical protein QM756_11105 [Polyangiaceae bacterium]
MQFRWNFWSILAKAIGGLLSYRDAAAVCSEEQPLMMPNRNDYVLAVLSTGNGQAFTPVQVQKLFFLLDAKAATELGGKQFNFAPYDYGPFDGEVYRVLENLQQGGYVTINRTGGVRTYQLSSAGETRGAEALPLLSGKVQEFARSCSDFVRRLSFADLVSAIYREFPEMRANSIFRDPV